MNDDSEDHFNPEALAAILLDRTEAPVDPPGMLAGLPASTYVLISRVARLGPRGRDETIQILNDEKLSALLALRWADNPPTDALRAALADDPYGRALLQLAPSDRSVQNHLAEPRATQPLVALAERWRQSASRFILPSPLGHAATSADSLPTVFTGEGEQVSVRVEARGDRSRFALVLDDTSGADGYVGVWLDADTDAPTVVVPLFLDIEARRSASIWCKYATEIRMFRLTSDEFVGEVLESVTRGVRAADGLTLGTWRRLAREAGPESALHHAVLDGLQ